MIQSFKHKGLKRLFENGETKSIRAEQGEKVENIHFVLNRARQPEDLGKHERMVCGYCPSKLARDFSL